MHTLLEVEPPLSFCFQYDTAGLLKITLEPLEVRR